MRNHMHTYPEMNARIVSLLRACEDTLKLYAAQRIEELEADLVLSAKMLARQTDLAREAETMRDLLRREVLDKEVGPF
jgi:hypothetical protein